MTMQPKQVAKKSMHHNFLENIYTNVHIYYYCAPLTSSKTAKIPGKLCGSISYVAIFSLAKNFGPGTYIPPIAMHGYNYLIKYAFN